MKFNISDNCVKYALFAVYIFKKVSNKRKNIKHTVPVSYCSCFKV